MNYRFAMPVILMLGLVLAPAADARPVSEASWPVTKFVNQNSVLARYYGEFVNRYPNYSTANQMHMFCDLLLSSDLLSDRLSQLGGRPSEMHAILMELDAVEFDRSSKFSKDDRHRIRSLLLGLDVQLESVEHSLSTGTRTEFRREVLADIPPLNRVG